MAGERVCVEWKLLPAPLIKFHLTGYRIDIVLEALANRYQLIRELESEKKPWKRKLTCAKFLLVSKAENRSVQVVEALFEGFSLCRGA